MHTSEDPKDVHGIKDIIFEMYPKKKKKKNTLPNVPLEITPVCGCVYKYSNSRRAAVDRSRSLSHNGLRLLKLDLRFHKKFKN